MSITFDQNSIDFTSVTTYGDLKSVLPSTGTGRVPGITQLQAKARILLHKETESGIIKIYDNGFFIYEEREKRTVFGVDRCEYPETYTYSGKREAGIENPDFGPYPWELILESAGAARLVHNADSRDEYQSEISIDAPESENNIALSVKPEHEIREEEEEIAAWKAARNATVAKEYERLRDDQKEIFDLYFIKKIRQEDIGKRLGIDRTSVTHRIATIKKRFSKFI